MKISTITPNILNGQVNIPPSKSYAHRAIICASLCNGQSIIKNVDFSQDIEATVNAMKNLGATISVENNILTIDGSGMFSPKKTIIDCNESGSTLRFLLPVASAVNAECTFIGKGKLPQRPIGEIISQMKLHGVETDKDDGLPIALKGQLTGGDYHISGNISSQFVSGLLFALPLCKNDSKIILTTKLESESYVDMTIDTIKKFGVKIEKTDFGYSIKGNQKYIPCEMTVEGDWSQAAFFLVADALGSNVQISGLNKQSLQGDKKILDILVSCGCDIRDTPHGIVCRAEKLLPFEADVSNIPDLVPILAVLACFCDGTSKIYGAERLKLKESDRLTAISENLNNVGAHIIKNDDSLIIEGCGSLLGGKLKGYNDHRIVMALSIASTRAHGKIVIDDAQSINKSYPRFFEDFNNAGGKANVIDLG